MRIIIPAALLATQLILLLHYTKCFQPICQPNEAEYVGPPLPTLPDQYVSFQELTPANLNISSRIDEYFDYKRNKAVTIITSMGLKSKTIYDYSKKKQYVISGTNSVAPTCYVKDIINLPDGLLVLGAKNGHLKHAMDVIMFNKSNKAIMYRGITTVRGIRCNTWSLCMNSANSSYLLQYHFAVDGWVLPTQAEHFTPILITINGSFIIQGVREIQATNTAIHAFSFEGIVPPNEAFEITPGVLCDEGMSNATVPLLPNDFFIGYEYFSPQDSMHHVIRAYYDFTHGLARITSTTHTGDYTYRIMDYHGGLIYDIKHVYTNPANPFICQTSMLKQDGNANETKPHFTMKTAMEKFNLSPFKYIYQGVGKIRGRDVNIWVSSHNASETFGGKLSIIEWSFLRSNNKPVQLVIYDKSDRNNKTIVSIFTFDPLDPSQRNLQSLSYCYYGNRQLITFKLINNFAKDVSVTARDYGIKQALAKYGSVPLLRVASTEVFDRGEVLLVVTTVFGPVSLTNGSHGSKVPIQIPLKVAVGNIKKAIESGQFEVMLNQSGVVTKTTAVSSSFSIGNKMSSSSKDGESGLTVTQVVIIVVIIVFIVIAVVSIIYIALRRRGINLFAYEKYGGDNDGL